VNVLYTVPESPIDYEGEIENIISRKNVDFQNNRKENIHSDSFHILYKCIIREFPFLSVFHITALNEYLHLHSERTDAHR
jgi:hypothetical protein